MMAAALSRRLRAAHLRRAAVVAALFAALAPVAAQDPAPRLDTYVARLEALALMQTLNAEILASRSATVALENWCRAHRFADASTIVARRIPGVTKTATTEQRKRLDLTDRDDVKYRKVQLLCGGRLLSEADNWYVPSRLTPEMNRLLDTTETPFGTVVRSLDPYRQTFAVNLLWAPLPDGWDRHDQNRPFGAAAALAIPDALFEHRAVLYTRDHRPFSEVSEVYHREILAMPAASTDERAIRTARASQNRAIAAGDFDRAAAFWTEDVTVRRALGQNLNGRSAARTALEPPSIPESRLVYQRLTDDVETSSRWPLAFETGLWEGHQGSVEGPAVIGGRYSAQWVKRADQWLIRSEVFAALSCSGVGCQSQAVP